MILLFIFYDIIIFRFSFCLLKIKRRFRCRARLYWEAAAFLLLDKSGFYGLN